MNIRAFLNTATDRAFCLPVVILYVTAGCNLRCITCSYRHRLPNELSLAEYKDLAGDLHQFGLRQVVYSGGEPLTRKDFPGICAIFAGLQVRQTLLTNGLLLEKRFKEILPYFGEIIISVDGPRSEVHDSIRGLACFDEIIRGIRRVVRQNPRPLVSIRTVVQRRNFRYLDEMIGFAKREGVDRISFLSADVLSTAFHRDHDGPVTSDEEILLTAEEVAEFRDITGQVLKSRASDFETRFVSESPSKMLHLVEYFGAFHKLNPFPRNHCNAPMVSTVITSTGEILPCYFLPRFGNVRGDGIAVQLNSESIRTTRKDVRSYSLEECQKCVCTLNISPILALRDRF